MWRDQPERTVMKPEHVAFLKNSNEAHPQLVRPLGKAYPYPYFRRAQCIWAQICGKNWQNIRTKNVDLGSFQLVSFNHVTRRLFSCCILCWFPYFFDCHPSVIPLFPLRLCIFDCLEGDRNVCFLQMTTAVEVSCSATSTLRMRPCEDEEEP